jgi:predicted RNA binding protein YcfA (HicA-like mRNA interferase family)
MPEGARQTDMSQSKPTTYEELFSLLAQLGFEDESVRGSHHAFRHRPSETLILLAPMRTDDPVRREDGCSYNMMFVVW